MKKREYVICERCDRPINDHWVIIQGKVSFGFPNQSKDSLRAGAYHAACLAVMIGHQCAVLAPWPYGQTPPAARRSAS